MNKKGVSLMVSYILLIVIALSISVLVYAFLNLYVPKEKPECRDGINIIIKEVTCINKELLLDLQNTGRFKISSAYVRIGEEEGEFREWVNDPNEINSPENFYFFDVQEAKRGLFPGKSERIGPLDVSSIVDSPGNYILEVQPAIFTGEGNIEDLALCPPITQKISCT